MKFLYLILPLLFCLHASAAETKRPNMLFVFADD